MKRPAPPKISSAVTESAWPPFLSVMVMMIVGMPVMRRSAQLPAAVNTSFVVMTLNASLPCGAVTGIQTVKTNRTNPWSAAAAGRSLRNLDVQLGSFSAAVESAYTCTGCVTEMQTAKINQMKQTVVSQLWLYQCLRSWTDVWVDK